MRRRSLLALLAFFALHAAPSAAQQRAMTPEDLLALRGVGDPQVSPDGRWVAYVVSVIDMKANETNSDVWLVPAVGGEAIRLTTSPKADNHPRWAPDGKRIAFLSSREERAQIWLISPFGGEAEKLTSSKTAVSDFEWSPEGARIAYVAPREPTPEEERREKEKDDAKVVDGDFRQNRLWIVEVKSAKADEAVKGEFHVSDPQWSPDGARISYTVNPTPKPDDGGRSDVYLLEVATGRQARLLQHEGPDFGARWSPDGARLALVIGNADRVATGHRRLVVVPSSGGATRDVAPDFLYQPGSVTWAADGATLYLSASVRTTSQMFAVSSNGGPARQLSELEGVLSGGSVSKDGRTWAFTVSDLQHPNDVHVATGLSPFRLRRITDANPQVRDLALGRGEVIRWKGRDGLEIEGVVVYPVGYEPGKRYPTVARIHGGPAGAWTQSFPGSTGNPGHLYAGRGWVVFYPNVRGSSGYGEKFLHANTRDWGGGDYQDIQSGLDELIRRGIADPERMAQSGWSYGGYMTAWTITQTNRFKAAMVGAGLTNMYSMYSTNDLQTVLEEYFGGEPWNDTEGYWSRSAMAFIKQARTPTLILHGQQDLRVPVGQAQELYMGLKKNGVPVTLVFYPREGHGLTEPKHQLDRVTREYDFFAKYVLGDQKRALVP